MCRLGLSGRVFRGSDGQLQQPLMRFISRTTNRDRTETEPGYNRDRTETEPGYNRDRTETDRSHHGVSLSRPADDLLHHAVGSGGRRGSVPGAQRTQPGCDRHQSHPHSRLLLLVLVGGHPGSGQPSVRPSAEE